MRRRLLVLAVLVVSGLVARAGADEPGATPAPAHEALRTPASFADIADPHDRSIALFVEAGKVLQSPRCLNCHPVGARPTQTDAMRPHMPLVVRGPDGHGAAGVACASCHQAVNFEPSGVPGNRKWALAPASMAWQHQTLGQICVRLVDSRLNGGRDLNALIDHMAHDDLVGWGWAPGAGRAPAPGTQAEFGALIAAWVKDGAACPAP